MTNNSSAPTVRDALFRMLKIFERVGTEAQRREAEALEKELRHDQPPEAVSFATSEDPAATEDKQ